MGQRGRCPLPAAVARRSAHVPVFGITFGDADKTQLDRLAKATAAASSTAVPTSPAPSAPRAATTRSARFFGNDWNWIVAGAVRRCLVLVLDVFTHCRSRRRSSSPCRLCRPRLHARAAQAVRRASSLGDRARPGRLRAGLLTRRARGRAPAERRRAIARHANRPTASRHLADIARDVFGKVEAKPASALPCAVSSPTMCRAPPRLPKATRCWRTSARPTRATRRSRRVIEKLEGAFVHYADSLADAELGGLDIDLKTRSRASLKEDLGR